MYVCDYVYMLYNANRIGIGPELWNANDLHLRSLFIILYTHLGTIS